MDSNGTPKINHGNFRTDNDIRHAAESGRILSRAARSLLNGLNSQFAVKTCRLNVLWVPAKVNWASSGCFPFWAFPREVWSEIRYRDIPIDSSLFRGCSGLNYAPKTATSPTGQQLDRIVNLYPMFGHPECVVGLVSSLLPETTSCPRTEPFDWVMLFDRAAVLFSFSKLSPGRQLLAHSLNPSNSSTLITFSCWKPG